MSTVAEAAACCDRAAGDLEASYSNFCKAGRPVTTILIFILGMALLTFAVAYLHVRSGSSLALEPLYNFTGKYIEEIIFATPAIVAAIRGRRFLNAIVLGRMSPVGMIVLGVGVGSACVFASTVVGLSYFRWPQFNSEGFARAFGGLPVTAYLLGPVGEEMLYQVGLQTWLQRFGSVAAVIGATLPFWGFHLYGGFVTLPVALFYLLPSIFAYALIRQTTKSLGAAVLAHSTYNICISFLLFVPR